MGETHDHYSINRKAAERVFQSQSLERIPGKIGWSDSSQFDDIGEFLAFGLDRPRLSQSPTPAEIAPILRWKIRDTIPRMTPQYFCLLELSYHLRRQYLVKADLNVEEFEADFEAVVVCGIQALLQDQIDDRTLWCILTIHAEWVEDALVRLKPSLTEIDRRRITRLKKEIWRLPSPF